MAEATGDSAHRFTFYAAHSHLAIAVNVFDYGPPDQESALAIAMAQYERLP